MIRPSEFMLKYFNMKIATESEYKYISIRRYVSGEPRKKKWVKEAFWDFECFVKKQQRYEPAKGNFTANHELYGNAFVTRGWVGSLSPAVLVTWSQMSMCFYGKGTPDEFAMTLAVISYYLNHAKLPLEYLGWSRACSLQDYADYYLGLDCNGFAGSFYKVVLPETGIDGNDHINFHDTRKSLAVRDSFDQVRVGDMLAREGSSGGGTRHVALIESLQPLSASEAKVKIAHSSGSRDGLSLQEGTLKKLSGKTSDGHGKLLWDIEGYHKFHHIVGPK